MDGLVYPKLGSELRDILLIEFLILSEEIATMKYMLSSKFIQVRLTPRASSNKIQEGKQLDGEAHVLFVYVTEPPEDGKANKAMLKLLSKYYGIAVSRFEIIRGASNRNKLIKINNS